MLSYVGLILKELLPILLKLSFREYKMVSIAVKIPTSAVMPTVMIRMVSADRNKLDLNDPIANLMFSKYIMM
jgi:hypothetical protein